MKQGIIFLVLSILCLSLACCCNQTTQTTSSWKDELKVEIPLLGHRNWIVITDMAYPLQTAPGIKTIYINESYMDILDFVYKEIDNAPHIKAAIYQDKELSYIEEKDAAGIDALRKQMKTFLGDCSIAVPHDELIARLDEVSRMFNVVILKSNLTIPYTTTFFELDCNYWENDKEVALRKKLEQFNDKK